MTAAIDTIVAGLLILVITGFLVIGCARESDDDTYRSAEGFGAPDFARVESINHADGGLQGYHSSHGIQIYWSGMTSDGADTLDVVNALIGRMQFEQNTDAMASDQNARALAHLMMARQELEGKTTTTEDGLPILE